MKLKITQLKSIILSLFIGSSLFSSDQCSDILNDGVKDTYNLSRNNTMQKSAQNIVCKNINRSRSGSSGFSIKLPIPELNSLLGLGSNSSYNNQRVSEFCKKSSSSINKVDAFNFVKKIANKDIIKAWSDCMGTGGLGCQVDSIDNENFTLELSWSTKVTGATNPEILDKLQLTTGNCNDSSLLSVGKTIKRDVSITVQCKRDGSQKRIIATLNTTQGALKCNIPEVEQPKTSDDYLKDCVNGDYEGCQSMVDEANKKFNTCMENAKAKFSNPTQGQIEFSKQRTCGNQLAKTKIILNTIEKVWENCTTNFNTAGCMKYKSRLSMYLRLDSGLRGK